jgi:hypothetical protein
MTGSAPNIFANDLTRIDAWIQDVVSGVFYRSSFSPASILRLVDVSEAVSVIVLSDGAQVPVAMNYESLRQRIFEPDFRKDNVLNLFEQTGEKVSVARLQMAPAPAAAFNTAAVVPEKPAARKNDDTAEADQEFTVMAFIRKAQTDNYQILTVRESQIDWGKIVQEDTGRNGPLIKVPLLYGFKDPFGDNTSIIDMTNKRFMEFYTQAKMKGQRELNLLEETKPKLKTPLENVEFKKIAMFIRKKGTQNYTLDICKNESYFDWPAIREINDIHGPAIMIPLKGSVKSEFGDNYLLADISHAEFMRLYMNAKALGLREFDLRQETGRFVAPDMTGKKPKTP